MKIMQISLIKTTLFLLIILLLTNCNAKKNIEIKKTTFLIGKTYVQDGKINPDPEYGGLDFIKFDSKSSASIKNGDIVFNCNYLISQNKILVSNKDFGINNEFIINNDSVFTDKYNIKWNLKKN